MTSTNPAPEKGEVSAEDAAVNAEDLAVRTGASPELMANSIGEYVRIWLKQIRSGESGALPVIIGLVVDRDLLPGQELGVPVARATWST